jgi:ATP-dependent Zn protease
LYDNYLKGVRGERGVDTSGMTNGYKKPERRDYGNDEFSYEDDMIRYMNGTQPLGPNVKKFATQEEADAYNRQFQQQPQPNYNYNNYSVASQRQKKSSGAATGFFVILSMILAIVGNYYMWWGSDDMLIT